MEERANDGERVNGDGACVLTETESVLTTQVNGDGERAESK
jgi:hypothetical protein